MLFGVGGELGEVGWFHGRQGEIAGRCEIFRKMAKNAGVCGKRGENCGILRKTRKYEEKVRYFSDIYGILWKSAEFCRNLRKSV